MAQRRVNIKAVGIILVVIIGVLGSITVAKAFLFKKDPKKFIALAEGNIREGNYVDAEANYKIAVVADPKNLDARVKYGDVLHQLARTDRVFLGQDRAAWDGVLQANPTHREALQRMLQSEIEIVEFFLDPRSINRLHEISLKILKLPTNDAKDEVEKSRNATLNARAKAYLHISVIAGWMAEIVTPEAVIQDNAQELAKLLKVETEKAMQFSESNKAEVAAVAQMSEGPKKVESQKALQKKQIEARINPDIPYYLGNAYVRQARELRTRGDVKEAGKLERQAYSMFLEVTHVQPDNAVLALRFYQVLRAVSDAIGDSPDDENKADKQEYVKQMKDVLEGARAGVASTDPACTEVYVSYAQYLLRNKDPVQAEKVLRDLCALKPNDQTARLTLAALIHSDPQKRAEAIALLQKPITDPGEQGVLSYKSKLLVELQTFIDLTNYMIESYGSISDVDQRTALAKEVDDNYAKVMERAEADPNMRPATLKLKGKISLMKGGQKGAIEAIPDFEKARELWKQLHTARNEHDWELEYLVATAYVDSNQSGLAKQRLWDIVTGVPSFIPARVMLIRLLIANHDGDLAREQLREFKRAFPTDGNTPKLEMALYLIEPTSISQADIAKVIESMPETTPQEMRAKIPVYIAARKIDDAIRLYEALRKTNPSEVDVVRTLVQIYMSQDKKDLAAKITEEALVKEPDNVSLQIVQAQIEKNQEKVIALTLKALGAIKIPLDRELSLYEFYLNQNDKVAAMTHLDAAEKADPENGRIMDLRFGTALQEGKYDIAEKYANRLAVKDYDEAGGLIYKYRLALVKGELKAAEEVARELVKTREQFARSWLCYGDVLKDEHLYEEAAGKYQMALQKQSENIEAYRGLIECNYQLKKPEEAKRFIDAGLNVNPGNAWLTEQRTAWELNYGDPTKALESRKLTATQNADSLGAQLAFGAAQWQVAQHLENKSKSAEAKVFAAQSRETFTAIVAKWPDDRFAYAYLADIATYANDFPAGEKLLQQFAARDQWKDIADPSILLGDYYFRFGKSDLAEKAYLDGLSRLKVKNDAAALEVERKAAAFFTSQKKYAKALEILQPVATDRRVQQQLLEIMLADGKLTEAHQLLDKQIQANPNDSQFMATRGFLLLQEKKIPEALETLNKAVALDPRNQTALYYRGMIKLRKGPESTEDAIKDLTAARDTTNDPNSQASITTQLQTRMGLAEALRAHGQTEDAVQEISQCLILQPGNKEIRMKLIEMLGTLITPRWGEVERLITEAEKMKEFEKDPDWRSLRSKMWVTRNQPEKALDSIRDAIRLSQGQPQRTLPLMQDYLSILARLKKYRELLAECNDLLKNPELAQSAWWVYHMRATAYANMGDKRVEAITDFDKALEITSRLRSDDASVLIIQSIADTIGLEEAISRCEREAAKGDSHWRVILTYLYFSKKDYVHAEATIERVLADSAKLTPAEKETAYGVAGSVYMLTGEYKKASDVYEKLLDTSGEDTVALNNLACIWAEYQEKPDPAKALVFSRKAMEVMQKRGFPDANILDTHGWVLTCNDKVDEGITFLTASLDRKPMMETYYHLGVAYLKKNLIPEAQQQLERARKMMEDRKNKGQPTDARMETALNESLVKAKQLMNAPTTSPVTSGTGDAVKP